MLDGCMSGFLMDELIFYKWLDEWMKEEQRQERQCDVCPFSLVSRQHGVFTYVYAYWPVSQCKCQGAVSSTAARLPPRQQSTAASLSLS